MCRRSSLLPVVLVIIGCATGSGTVEHLDECPNPAMESMSWRSLEGVVIEVRSVREFQLRTRAGDVVAVTIANVGPSSLAGSAEILKRIIDGKSVTLFINSSAFEEAKVSGEVHTANGSDVARQLLRSGAAPFEPAAAYTLSDYSECLNRIAEREARERHAGLWANAMPQR